MKKVFSIILSLCIALSTVACLPNIAIVTDVPEESESPPKAVSSTAPMSGEAGEETLELYDLNVTVPLSPEAYWLVGHERYLRSPLDEADETSLTITPQWLSAAKNQNGYDTLPTELDASGTPVLTVQSITDHVRGDDHVHKQFGEGTLKVGEMPAAYIEIELYSAAYPDDVWKAKLTRVVYGEFRYDFVYLARVSIYEEYLPAADKIVASAGFYSGEAQTESVTFGDITLKHPVRDVNVDNSEQALHIAYIRNRDNIPHFYVIKADDQLYSEGMLTYTPALDEFFQIRAQSINILEPKEISREEIEINGKRAVRAIYHDDFRQYDNYLEMILFVHNGDLYTIFGQCDIGNENGLHSFIQPMIGSIRFGEASSDSSNRPIPLANTLKWINYTCAVITIRNGGSLELLGGFEPNDTNARNMQDMLWRSWDITDRASADAALNRLYQTGQRASFLEFAKNDPLCNMEYEEFQAALEKLPEDERQVYSSTYGPYFIYQQFGDKSLLAWDYCRMINIIGAGYIAGYYTEEEALDLSLKIALELQAAYTSWDDMYRNYLAGFNYWMPGDVTDESTENYVRFMIWVSLQHLPDGPYNSLLWDTKLAPDWQNGIL